MQSPNNESGGLNFVFESGSSGRENKKYVRSHAARVGWSQRSRKQAQAANKDVDVAPNKDTTPKKRRKTSHQGNNAGRVQHHQQTYIPPPAAQPVVDQAGTVAGPAAEASTSPSTLPTQLPPQQHAKRGGQLIPFAGPRAPSSFVGGPARASATTTSSSPSLPFQQLGQPAAVRAQDVRTSPPAQVAPSAASGYPSTLEPSHWHMRSDPVQHDSVAQPSYVPLFRPAASPVTMHPPQIVSGAGLPRSVPQTSPLPSPRLPPLATIQTSQPLSIGANWRQYDNMSATNSEASHPSTPVQPTTTCHEENTEASATRSPQRSSPRASTSFLELVLNEDYPMWKNVDAGSDSFSVFPVKWQPFYGRLLHNYRSNMLVQLDEILTGWTTDQKLEFNQMPLRLAGSEPCLFYSVLATASVMMPPGLVNPGIPRWLSARTVECINQVLQDPKRAYSDAAILTVNMVALFEGCSGHGAAAAEHQPILRRMVDERGGLTSIARKDNEDSKNLVRFIAWADRVIRCQTGNPLMFEDFKEEESVTKTDWNGIWARMERRVEENNPQPIEELPDC
ncbi:hypothetical protein KCU85_g5808, partial [Aureobasidium melanogenum]